MNAGDRVTGEYYGEAISGTVRQVDPNWEVGSRGINVYVDLDAPLADGRTSVAYINARLSAGRWETQRAGFLK